MTEQTYLHGEITYWFPLGADPDFAGEFLRYGLAISHVCYDGDAFGIVPTLEFVGWTVLDGQETLPNTDPLVIAPRPVDGLSIMNVYPGVRFIFDSPGDWGHWDFGIAGGVAVTADQWYDSVLLANLRFIF